MSPSRNSEGLPSIPLGNSANSLFDMEDSFEITSTEESLRSPNPPATKMDFGLAEMKREKENQNQTLILISFKRVFQIKVSNFLCYNLETKPF